jgi:hypothetical protein
VVSRSRTSVLSFNKLWTWPILVLLGLALMSRHLDEPARADVPQFNLNEAFTLAGGQEGLIPSEKLRLRFAQILEDSRCPTQVECFWTGQARIAISVHPEGGGSTTVEFNTNPAPGQTVKVVDVGQYSIELQSLDPYPQTPDAIAFEDYRAKLAVRKR